MTPDELAYRVWSLNNDIAALSEAWASPNNRAAMSQELAELVEAQRNLSNLIFTMRESMKEAV